MKYSGLETRLVAELGFGVNSTVWLCRDLRQGFELHLQLVKIFSNILIGNEAFGMPALNANLSPPPPPIHCHLHGYHPNKWANIGRSRSREGNASYKL